MGARSAIVGLLVAAAISLGRQATTPTGADAEGQEYVPQSRIVIPPGQVLGDSGSSQLPAVGAVPGTPPGMPSQLPAVGAVPGTPPGTPFPEGKLSDLSVVAGPFDLHRRYRSMEGPWVSAEFSIAQLAASPGISLPEDMVTFVEDGGRGAGPSMGGGASSTKGSPQGVVTPATCKRELFWLKRLKVETVDEKGEVIPSNEFLCHLNLDLDLKARASAFPGSEIPGSERVLTFQQGLTDITLPAGYAIPLASDEKLRFSFQAANRTTEAHRRITLRCVVTVIADKELWYPVTALTWQVPQIQVVVDGETPTGVAAAKKNCPCCKGISRGVNAPNSVASSVWTDASKQVRSGHWVVPPGKHTFTDPVNDLTPAFASRSHSVHAVWAHVHPFCREISIVQPGPTERRKVLTIESRTRIRPIGFEIEKVGYLSSTAPIVVPQGGPYEVEVSYDNLTSDALDSMATIGVLYEDESFRRPRWAIFDMDANACEVPVAATDDVPAAAPWVPGYPLFDFVKDGPLLVGARSASLETTSGKLGLLIDPSLAPGNASQLCKLLDAGAYDGVEFFRYEPGFVLQCTNAETKAAGHAAITSATLGELRRLPLEVQAQNEGRVRHVAGVLSMARDTSVVDSAVSSFSILLGEAPHLDRNFTIVGRLVDAPETLATLERMQNDWVAGKHPVIVRTRTTEAPSK